MVGVLWYIASWVVAGALIEGYDPLRQAISATFAMGVAPVPLRIMHAALVGTGVLLVVFAVALDRGLPGSGPAGPVAMAVSGVATAVLTVVPCSPGCPGADTSVADLRHVVVAAVGYLALMVTPLLVARRVRHHAAAFARWSVVLATLSLVGFGVRYLGVVDQLGGLQQRVFNTLADAWVLLAGAWLIRRARTRTSPDH